jgi:hypothetical protein
MKILIMKRIRSKRKIMSKISGCDELGAHA